jgi:GR25 family glycosyltransferase involved in LPS biosynthesis
MIDIHNIKSYIINLEKYKNKYNLCLNKLNKINIYPERFNAIYIDDENSDYIKSITYPSVQYTIKNGRYAHNNIGSKGAIGCYLSHITLWKMLLESNEDIFLIFEDDIDINKNIINFNNNLNKDLNNINKEDWDIIFLGYYDFNNIFNSSYDKNNKCYKKINYNIYGTHSYIINKNGAQKLLKNAFPIIDQIDSYISYMSITRNVNAYKLNNKYFFQNSIINSTIQTDYSIKPFITQYEDTTLKFIVIIIILLLIFFIILCINYKFFIINSH